MGLNVGIDGIARNVTNAYVGVIEMTNLCPKINGATNFTIRSNSGTATGESSTVHTKYSQQSLKLNITDTNTAEVYASSSTSLPLNPEHIYYARIEAYQETKFGAVELYFPIAEPQMFNLATGDVGKWNMYSVVKERSSFTAGNYTFRLDFNRERSTKTAGSIWYDGWMIIDLTETFGSGNEPTKEWCDANIPYFEGTTAVRNYNAVGTARKIKQICIGDENGIARLAFPIEKYNGMFIVVGDAGFINYGKNGKTWTAGTGLSTSYDYNDVVYGNGTWVTIGDNKIVCTSTDGVNWKINGDVKLSGNNRIAYGNGTFVAVGNSYYAYCTDVASGEWYRNDTTDVYLDVIFARGEFLAVGVSENNKPVIARSTDGATWASTEITDFGSIEIYGVAFGGGKYVCVTGANKIIYSTDLANWSEVYINDIEGGSLAYGNGMFVLVADYDGGDTAFYHSTDGINWYKSDLTLTQYAYLRDVTYGNGMFVAVVGRSGTSNVVYYSKDGVNWETATLAASGGLRGIGTSDIEETTWFTSNIIPKFTSNSTTTTLTDKYGEWKASANSVGSGTGSSPVNAVDRSSSTYWQSNTIAEGATVYWSITCPIKINPKVIYIDYRYFGGGKIEGYDPETNTYRQIVSLSKSSSLDQEIAITTDRYFTRFRVTTSRYSSSSNKAQLRTFEIRKGGIK